MHILQKHLFQGVSIDYISLDIALVWANSRIMRYLCAAPAITNNYIVLQSHRGIGKHKVCQCLHSNIFPYQDSRTYITLMRLN